LIKGYEWQEVREEVENKNSPFLQKRQKAYEKMKKEENAKKGINLDLTMDTQASTEKRERIH